MSFDRVLYYLRETARNFRTAPIVTAVSTVIITLSILIFGLFLMIFTNFQSVFEHWGRKVRVDAYLADGITDGQLKHIENAILAIDGVVSAQYVSKEEALREFQGMLGGQDELLNELGANPLPASFKVNLRKTHRDPDHVKAIAGMIKRLKGVDDVRYGAEWVDKFALLVGVLEILGLIVGGIMLLSSLLIISNTISLTIYARREEIDIMRLVGATESLIKAPFFLGGMMQGLLAGLFAVGLLWLLYWLVLARLELPFTMMGPAMLSFLPSGYSIGLVAGAAVLGMLGSVFAVGREKMKI